LMPAILFHHSAEYLPPITASRQRMKGPRYMHNRGDIMYAVSFVRGLVRDGRHASARPEGLGSKPLKLDRLTA
jgi:hypothetical protein